MAIGGVSVTVEKRSPALFSLDYHSDPVFALAVLVMCVNHDVAGAFSNFVWEEIAGPDASKRFA